jgi:xanthine/uracil permease
MIEIYLIGLVIATVYASKTLYDNTVNYNTRYTKNSIFWVVVAVLAYPIIGSIVLAFYGFMSLIKLLDKINDHRL